MFAQHSLDQALLKAKSHIRKNELQDAQKIYQIILKNFPYNKRAQQGIEDLKKNHSKNSSDNEILELVNLFNKGLFSDVFKKAQLLSKKYQNLIIIWNLLGASATHLGIFEIAIKAYEKILSLNPDYADAYYNMGVIFQNQGYLIKAIKVYKKVISIQPDHVRAYSNMGVSLKDQGKLNEAIEVFNKVILIKPNYADAYNNIGIVFRLQGKLEKSILSFKKAISINPNYTDAFSNMGVSLKEQGKLDEAIIFYKKAISINPHDAETHHNLSFTLLKIGKLDEGLEEHEWRWKTAKLNSQKRHFLKPMWDGEKKLNGKKILIWSEQGIGDTINWSSALSHISSKTESCTLECQEKLVPLLKHSFPGIIVKPENKILDAKKNDFDFHLPMGSLYKNFISEISQTTKVKPFLIPIPKRVNFWRKRLNSLGKGPYIGISWKSSDMSNNRLPNYAPLKNWQPLFLIPNVIYVNLQYKDFESDLMSIQNDFGVTVHNFDDLDHYNNLLDVAAFFSALDCVVSIRNSVPLISAGVGTLTKLAGWKQSAWNNILHNPVGPFIKKFERDIDEPWVNIFNLIAKDILKLSKNWNYNE